MNPIYSNSNERGLLKDITMLLTFRHLLNVIDHIQPNYCPMHLTE